MMSKFLGKACIVTMITLATSTASQISKAAETRSSPELMRHDAFSITYRARPERETRTFTTTVLTPELIDTGAFLNNSASAKMRRTFEGARKSNKMLAISAPQNGACHSECTSDSTHCVYITSLPSDFCSTTGQSDWCSSHVGSAWCICKWAYKSYTSKKNSCTAVTVDKAKTGKSNNDYCYVCGSYTSSDKAYECMGCSACR
eukprot:gnl/MRDRNA2_/MRDRNA2_147712_c0_seq1.p1 gnl/MRDRNA2_/MRDRNA2_147712_c0~~gnl/MRDRNA2_/MRDRNA2_147712_c0_seq1.p1  ORF type:complete len:203 (+),score=31.66 gnl/MRDRNA2_/MRDRNA2_147712_c0_seq1:102-710(+)